MHSLDIYRIHKVEDNIVQSPPGWWCSLCGGLGRHRPDCHLYQVRLVRSHRHKPSDGAEPCAEENFSP